MPASFSIVPLNSGHLECQNSDCGTGTYWCRHIEQYVRDERDAQSIWDEARPKQGDALSMTGVKIQVPYVPTLGQWALVEVGTESHGNYKVDLHWGDVKTDIRTGEIQGVDFLGFFSPGEGRRVLRDMVHAWFLPRIVEEDLQCASTAHSFQAQLEWDRAVTNGTPGQREYLAQCWSVFTKDMCLRCAAADQVTTGDDLVPDVSAGRRGWR